MKVFKVTAILALVLLLAAGAYTLYLYKTARVEILGVRAEGISAAADPGRFEELRDAVEAETFMGTLYRRPEEWGDAAEYVFLNYTVRVANHCLLPAERVEARVVPTGDDILKTADFTDYRLEKNSEGAYEITLLSEKDTNAVREIIVTCYLWGQPVTIRANTAR